MGALVLALWALLVSLDPAGRAREPGKNLSCYQCFKVRSPEFCSPVVCSSTDQVCVSHVLIITLTSPISPGLPGPWLPGCPGCAWFQGRAQTRASSPEPCLCCDLKGLPVRTLLSKRCAPRCPSTNMEFEWRSDSGVLSKIVRHCCSRSLCNRAPVLQEGPRALPWGLLLQVGLSLLWVLL
ncbi:lymphocyte antigen 6L isoform X1 [Ovis aries]|uniref:lymphocyte antigen 6L isoform X1 n=1 Tax=Ovis aries TaxID=9940 RepID=UPI0005FBA2A0|nr:lymphocyte antigen 6L isoform X1 [Ovis aries]XP_042109919.1 lymphocyte antigen 6L isoform X1 [Ovis aries]